MKVVGILSITILVGFGYVYGATPFFADGGLTKNGIEWCEENYQLYQFMKQDFFEHHQHSIESRVCGNLYNDPLWQYSGPDRYEILVEKSRYYTNLEIEESKSEAETGVIDTKPVNEQEIPQIISQQQKELEQKTQNKTQTSKEANQNITVTENKTANQESDIIESSEQGGGCLVATAAYGSELSPQVQQLRELRDNTILKTSSGTAFMTAFNQFYYSFSPYIADYERENPVFKEIVKLGITPMLASLSLLNHTDIDSEYEMILYGVTIILINSGMYVGVSAMTIFAIKKLQ